MAVAYDNVSNAAGAHSATSPLTFSHTIIGNNAILLAGIAVDASSDAGCTATCMYNGSAMTSLGVVHSGAITAGFLQVFAIEAAAGTANVVATVTGGTGVDWISGGSISFSGAAAPVATGLGTPATATGAGATTATCALASNTAGNLIAGFVATGQGTTATTAPSTSRFVLDNFGNGAAAAISGATSPATGSSVTMAWTMTSDDFAELLVEIKPFAGGGGPIRLPQQLGRRQMRRRKSSQIPQFNLQSPNVSIPVQTVTARAAVPVPALVPYITALGGTGAGYWTDQTGKPRLVVGDEAWALVANAGAWGGTWQSDITSYVTARAAQGYTAVEIDLATNPTTAPNVTPGKTWDGVPMFNGTGPTAAGDPSAGLNSSYWARVDYLINALAAAGMTLFANIFITYDISTGSSLTGLSSTQFAAYGTALGNRYATTGNLQWLIEDDYFGTNDGTLDTVLAAIRAAGDSHPIATENYAESTSRRDVSNNTAAAWGLANAQYSWVYSYNVAYFGVEYAYTETSPVTVIRGDGYYYKASGDEQLIRNHLWWALSSGSRGFFGGDDRVWQWQTGALATVTTGAFQTSVIGAATAAFAALPGWQKLVPDTGNVFITAGRGTRATSLASGGAATPYSGTTDNYVSGSIAADGSLAVIYCLQHFSITVDQTKMAAGYTAAWMDPLTGTKTLTTSGTTYNSTPQGNNSGGNADWVLILQAPPVAQRGVERARLTPMPSAGPAGFATYT